MEYKGRIIANIDGVKGETIHAWMNAVDDYERLLTQQAEKGGSFDAACAAAEAVRKAQDAIDAEYDASHEPLEKLSELTFSDIFGKEI